MKVSVVIPVYNRKKALIRAIDSVFLQSHKADEIIIVDDNSSENFSFLTDDKYSVVKYPR